jgi:2-dehydro-3-deoxygalactonokinase
MAASFISLDWGTSSFRACLVDAAGTVIAERSGPDGILSVADGAFEPVLERHIHDWDPALPVMASGMITSRQGWIEVPYVSCPAGLAEIARGLRQVTTSRGRSIRFIPGMSCGTDGFPDVMRGEETQVLGALQGGDGQFVLPGTHSKWVSVRAGRITGFTSCMTGEVYAALREHTILGRLMQEGGHDPHGFAQGVKLGLEQGHRLLHAIFSTRTLGLFNRLPPAGLASYLSGLLIGAEISGERQDGEIMLIGSPELCARYAEALAVAGRTSVIGPRHAAVLGQRRIAEEASIIT